jgi:hypothetical protein
MNDLWDEIIENTKAKVEPRRPTEMTLEEFMERTGIDKVHTARKYMDDLVHSGKMRKRMFGRYMLYEPV